MKLIQCVDIRIRRGKEVCYDTEIVDVDLVATGEEPDFPLTDYAATFTGAFIFVGLFYILGMKIRTVLKIFK